MVDNASSAEGKLAGGDVTVEEFMAHDYDYIVCGGGTAGLVIAARLSEDPDIAVGVIEAGKNRIGDPLVETPGLCFAMLSNPDYDWTMKTVPQVWLYRRDRFPPSSRLHSASTGPHHARFTNALTVYRAKCMISSNTLLAEKCLGEVAVLILCGMLTSDLPKGKNSKSVGQLCKRFRQGLRRLGILC